MELVSKSESIKGGFQAFLQFKKGDSGTNYVPKYANVRGHLIHPLWGHSRVIRYKQKQ